MIPAIHDLWPFEPQRNYKFFVFFQGTIMPPFLVKSVDIPVPGVPAGNQYYAGRQYPTVDTHELESINITFWEDSLGTVMRNLLYWKKKIVDDDGFYHYYSDYRRDIYVFVLSPQLLPLMSYRFVECWPSGTTNYDTFDYEGNEVITISQEFATQRMEHIGLKLSDVGNAVVDFAEQLSPQLGGVLRDIVNVVR